MSDIQKSWCAKGQYPGKEPFYLGTVCLPTDAKQHEVDQAINDLWHKLMPCDPPKFVAVPGYIFFKSEE